MNNFLIPLENANQSGAIRVTTQHVSGEIVIPKEIAIEEIEGEIWIKYRHPVAGKTKKPHGVLVDFLKLADEPFTKERVLAFAQKWGVLCFCRHDRIASHNTKCFPICDEPRYSNLVAFLEQNAKDDIEAIQKKMNTAIIDDIWFREPANLWHQYARNMRAVLRIIFSLRGDWDGNTLPDWEILRHLGASDELGRMLSSVQYYENQIIQTPIHQAPPIQQCQAISNILSSWIGDSYLVPHIEWLHQNTTPLSPGPIAQITLNASYKDVCLFNSEHLTLYSVLVAQCITALGSNRFVGQCACIQCKAHTGPCQQFTELKQGRGRPVSYCEICGPNIRQQQKSASRRRHSIKT